jgi:methionine synthase II (cobalamin-independent)
VDAIAFEPFLELAKKSKFAKGQITGPFTLAAALTDKNGRCAIYDATLREVIVKTLALKALWQVEKIKAAGAVPIIFIDEPSVSQLGTSAFLTVSSEMVVAMIKEVSDIIKENGGLSAVHCCGKCDWAVIFDTGVDIINLDAYSFAQNLSFCDTAAFLERGGKIAWGIVPTLDRAALEKANLPHLVEIFQRDVKYLTEKGIDEKIIIDNSLITPSCGAGALSEELAQKALRLTCELSAKLKEMYSER